MTPDETAEPRLLTPSDLAARLQISVAAVNQLRITFGWPHVALGPRTIRFTEGQVNQIIEQHTVDVDGRFVPPWERTGQTYLSWRRN